MLYSCFPCTLIKIDKAWLIHKNMPFLITPLRWLNGIEATLHDFTTGLRITGDLAGSDVEAVRSGAVAITPLRLALSGVVPDTFRASVERR